MSLQRPTRMSFFFQKFSWCKFFTFLKVRSLVIVWTWWRWAIWCHVSIGVWLFLLWLLYANVPAVSFIPSNVKGAQPCSGASLISWFCWPDCWIFSPTWPKLPLLLLRAKACYDRRKLIMGIAVVKGTVGRNRWTTNNSSTQSIPWSTLTNSPLSHSLYIVPAVLIDQWFD